MLAPTDSSTTFALTRPIKLDPHSFYLVRHGQTTLGAEGKYQGRKEDVELTDLGRAEVAALVPFLPSIPIFCSPLIRTVQTSKIISQALDIPFITMPELVDASIGDWGGKTLVECEKSFTSLLRIQHEQNLSMDFPNGESTAELKERTSWLLHKVSAPAIIVGHQFPLQILTCLVADIPTHLARKLWMDEASLSIVRPNRIDVLNFKNRTITA